MNRMNPKVDEFLRKAHQWQIEFSKLRSIVLDCQLIEELKWGQPCYTLEHSNIVMISGFKDNCILSFFKGALLQDAHSILEQPGEHTQAGRVIRFTHVREIVNMEAILIAYIQEAIEVEKAGLQVNYKKTDEFTIPDEFQNKLNDNPDLRTAFQALTPGRQRAYLLHFSSAKQSKTREARVDKYIQPILEGKGFNDCTCGLSAKMPSCDGSHKYSSR